ncbi:hypothetical protein B5F07_14700 [Lachnoclostridium sp. An169]|uniref:alpha-1,3-galactosidase-related protein n=1 Tax=Lachnoclostridium sp. An169 TaxID=1965569 RepID=UPI000B3A471A|nr:hypothetical protein [Lachnoclostridium sp. An169]OUP82173.1 hypothetical protein B5F07_14700 [Lachnoclostridium sp. An169]
MRTVYAGDYGIMPEGAKARQCGDEAERTLTERFRKMTAENPRDTRFVLEQGTYHFYPADAVKRAVSVSNSDQAESRSFGVFLEDLEHVCLEGQDAVFCFHGDMTPLAVSGCRHIEVKNLKITSAMPHGAEARVLRASEEAVEIGIDPGKFPCCIEDEKLYFLQEGEKADADVRKEPMFAAIEFDADTNRVRSGAGDTFPQVKARFVWKDETRTGESPCAEKIPQERMPEDGTAVVRLEGSFRVVPKPGNLLVLRHGKRVHPGMLVQHSEDVLVESVTVYHTAGLGIVFQFNRDITARGVAFTADHAGGYQIISGHDDGLHFSNNGGQITIENCRFRGLMDDPVNVHGTAAGIRKISGDKKVTGVYCHPQSAGFERWASPGDEIAFLRPEDRSLVGTARVASYRLITPVEFELELADKIPEGADENCSLENLTNTPSVLCRNNYFGSCRARGILVTTPGQVRIENNIFESSGSAVTITGDVREWYESGTCTDVSVRENQFLDCCTSAYQFCDGVIHIESGVDPQSEQMVHRNIRIEDNLFVQGKETVLFADHTGEIRFCGNVIWAGRGGQGSPRVVFRNCRDVQMEGNEIINFPDRYLQAEFSGEVYGEKVILR